MITPKEMILHLEADFQPQELQAIDDAIEAIDRFLLNGFHMPTCYMGMSVIVNQLTEVHVNRHKKIKEHIAEQYRNVGWKVSLEENLVKFECKI